MYVRICIRLSAHNLVNLSSTLVWVYNALLPISSAHIPYSPDSVIVLSRFATCSFDAFNSLRASIGSEIKPVPHCCYAQFL